MSINNELQKKWLGKLLRLNPATGRGTCKGKAPHKPLLLLSLLDMIEDGELAQRTFTRLPGLVLRFRTYGALVGERWPARLDMKMPFYYLKSQKFWNAFTIDMEPAQSPESCFVCEMDEEFYASIADPDFRIKARLLLISTYFSRSEQVALLESMGLGKFRDEKDKRRKEIVSEAEQVAQKKGRSARFSIQVVSQYKYTCALTGLRCMTSDGAAIVDAAHIDPWAKSGDDQLANGLALSKNAHWTFDQGLWSVRPDGRVVVARERFTENGPDTLCLASYAACLLQFALGTTLRPDPHYFTRHREHHGLRT